MSKDAVVRALGQYTVSPVGSGFVILGDSDLLQKRDSGLVPLQEVIGTLNFDAHSKLIGASKLWSRGVEMTEAEIGKALVTLLSGWAADGASGCTIEAKRGAAISMKDPEPRVPRLATREATITCGRKRIVVSTMTQDNGTESLTITEEIGNP
jgi:hypothetical protein